MPLGCLLVLGALANVAIALFVVWRMRDPRDDRLYSVLREEAWQREKWRTVVLLLVLAVVAVMVASVQW